MRKKRKAAKETADTLAKVRLKNEQLFEHLARYNTGEQPTLTMSEAEQLAVGMASKVLMSTQVSDQTPARQWARHMCSARTGQGSGGFGSGRTHPACNGLSLKHRTRGGIELGVRARSHWGARRGRDTVAHHLREAEQTQSALPAVAGAEKADVTKPSSAESAELSKDACCATPCWRS